MDPLDRESWGEDALQPLGLSSAPLPTFLMLASLALLLYGMREPAEGETREGPTASGPDQGELQVQPSPLSCLPLHTPHQHPETQKDLPGQLKEGKVTLRPPPPPMRLKGWRSPTWQLPAGTGKSGQEAPKPSSPSLASPTPSWGLATQSSLARTLPLRISLPGLM